jgi:hypothetical protein
LVQTVPFLLVSTQGNLYAVIGTEAAQSANSSKALHYPTGFVHIEHHPK